MSVLARILAIIGLSFSISSCSTTNPLPKDFYNSGPNHQLPPISFFMKKRSDELIEICKKESCSYDEMLVDGIREELVKAAVFQKLSAYRHSSDYQLQVAASRVDPNDAAQFAKTMVSAATLFVVPLNTKHDYRSEFVLSWQGIPIAEYKFSISHDETAYLFKDVHESKRFAAESMAARFLSTAQGEGIFTSEYLYKKLKAEDYRRDLLVPNRVNNYAKSEMFIYPNPLLGVQLRFRDPKLTEKNCDLFVYPIRRAEWTDTKNTLDAEIALVRKDINEAVKAGAYKAVEFSPSTQFLVKSENQSYAGVYSHGYILLSSGERVISEIYLFVMQDKFVKFRFTSKSEDSKIFESFVTQILPQINVPAESPFMENMRRQRRNSTVE